MIDYMGNGECIPLDGEKQMGYNFPKLLESKKLWATSPKKEISNVEVILA